MQEVQIKENELKECVTQKIVKDINVKTTSNILSSLHKGILIGSKKAVSACKLAKMELQPFLNYILPKQYTYDSSKTRTHQYSNEEKPPEYVNLVAVQSTGNGSCFFNSASILKVGDEPASDVLKALTAAELYLNAESYVDHECLTLSAHLMRRSKEILFYREWTE